MDPTPVNPIRLQTSVLSAAEKRLLVWMAGKLPRAVGSDHLTVLALAAMLLAGLSYWFASRHPAGLVLATACLAVNWFGDSLDGTVARVRQAQRPRYGFYVDHVVDAIGTVALLAGLAFSGYMSPAVAAVLLLAYLLVTIEIYLATVVLGTFRMAFLKVGPTELRLLIALGNTWVMFDPDVRLLGRSWLLFDVAGVIGAAGLVAAFLVSAARNTRALYLAEPLPPAAAQGPAAGGLAAEGGEAGGGRAGRTAVGGTAEGGTPGRGAEPAEVRSVAAGGGEAEGGTAGGGAAGSREAEGGKAGGGRPDGRAEGLRYPGTGRAGSGSARLQRAAPLS